MDITARIDRVYLNMTKKQKQIADYMRDNAEKMAFITLKDLSAEVGVTEMTVLNMCKTLGYNSFNEVKYEFRKLINQNIRGGFYRQNEYFNTAVPDYELENKEKLMMDICHEETQLMAELEQNFNSHHILEVAKMFLSYKRIVLCGRGISYQLCEYLACGLASVAISTLLVNTELNDNVYSLLPCIDEEVLMVAVSFPDYYFMTKNLAEYAKEKGAKIVAITDVADSEITEVADEIFLVRSTTRLALNTISAPAAFINLLVSAVKLQGGMERAECIGKEFSEMF
ncbi:MurR/RpiR family transcriptional regulator [Roseburia hominis]